MAAPIPFEGVSEARTRKTSTRCRIRPGTTTNPVVLHRIVRSAKPEVAAATTSNTRSTTEPATPATPTATAPRARPDRALGALQSGSLNALLGVSFFNAMGVTMSSLEITYVGEQWRFGQTGRGADRLDLQYSIGRQRAFRTGPWTGFRRARFLHAEYQRHGRRNGWKYPCIPHLDRGDDHRPELRARIAAFSCVGSMRTSQVRKTDWRSTISRSPRPVRSTSINRRRIPCRLHRASKPMSIRRSTACRLRIRMQAPVVDEDDDFGPAREAGIRHRRQRGPFNG